jgi:hypothetical protein
MEINAHTVKLRYCVGVGPQHFLFTNIMSISSDTVSTSTEGEGYKVVAKQGNYVLSLHE